METVWRLIWNMLSMCENEVIRLLTQALVRAGLYGVAARFLLFLYAIQVLQMLNMSQLISMFMIAQTLYIVTTNK